MLKFIKRMWFKFRLWRQPYVVGVDYGSGVDTVVWCKELDGTLYMIKLDSIERDR